LKLQSDAIQSLKDLKFPSATRLVRLRHSSRATVVTISSASAPIKYGIKNINVFSAIATLLGVEFQKNKNDLRKATAGHFSDREICQSIGIDRASISRSPAP
jgi:hypothetical protein